MIFKNKKTDIFDVKIRHAQSVLLSKQTASFFIKYIDNKMEISNSITTQIYSIVCRVFRTGLVVLMRQIFCECTDANHFQQILLSWMQYTWSKLYKNITYILQNFNIIIEQIVSKMVSDFYKNDYIYIRIWKTLVTNICEFADHYVLQNKYIRTGIKYCSENIFYYGMFLFSVL